MTERCEACDTDTPHDVSVEIREENPDSDFASYSREPYRVTACLECGLETATRMNNN